MFVLHEAWRFRGGILVSHNQHFEVPHLLSSVFTGRDDDIQVLNRAFTSVPSAQRQH